MKYYWIKPSIYADMLYYVGRQVSVKILWHETGFQKKPLWPQTPLNWQQQSNPPFKFLDQNKDPPKMRQKLGQYPA